ncbi:MAG: efflux RND transporter periplasmic adaptor subunit [Armatimonadota bacterium]
MRETRSASAGFLRKRWPLLTVLILIAAGTYVLAAMRNAGRANSGTTYEFGTVTRGDVRSFVSATGTIQPWKVVDIKSNVAGRVDRLFVDLGDRVKAGDLIALIDPTDTQAAFEQAKADLTAALAKKAQAEVSLVQQKEQAKARVLAAQKAVESARARLAQARVNMLAQPAITNSSIAQQEAALVSARKSATQARQNKAQLEEQLAQLRDVTIPLNIETVEANLAQAQANLETAQAEYDRQKELLAKGFVAKSDVETAYAKLATAQAALRTAQQRKRTLERENALALQELTTRIAAADAAIEESEARVKQAEAALQLAKENRYQIDVRNHEYAAAQAAVRQAEAELASARAELNQIAIKEKDIVSAQTQIIRSRAALKQAQTNLTYTRIVAPRDGVVIAKNVEEGTVVPSSRASIGSTNALVQLGDTSRLWVVCSVDETDIGQVSVGQKVTVKVDAYPSLLVDGKVIRIDPQATVEQNVTMIPVTVEILEPDERFKPGMSAECEFIVDEAFNVLTVPNEALVESDGVYRVRKLVNGQVKEFEVEVGIAGPDATEIRSGLKEGEQVITKIIEPQRSQVNNPFAPQFGRGPGGGGGMRGGR